MGCASVVSGLEFWPVSMTDQLTKLALGTVQFGLPYGVANQRGQVSAKEVGLILDVARNVGVTTLDTAISYGESEQVLGRQGLRGFSVVTKLPGMPLGCSDVAGWVESELQGSLVRLGVDGVDSLLLHRPGQLLEPLGPVLYRALLSEREKGRVRRIGVSVYDPEELDILCRRYKFDLVQAPFSILDKRMLTSGWLDRLQQNGTALHVRSVFMQGLLLMVKGDRPEKFARWDPQWDIWEQWLAETGQTPLQACLRYSLSLQQIERVVVGVDSLTQWESILQAAGGACPPIPQDLGCCDVKLLNPALWSHL